MKMSELGQVLGIENSAITQLVDRLEDAKFLRRKMDPNDRRVLLISATPEGKAEAEKAKLIIRKVNEEIKSGFTSREIDIFKAVLSGILERFKK
jgi:DNA-binding MarR family transcriptional regulator